jgi:hypothetical protein
MLTDFWWEGQKRKVHWEDLGINKRIYILKKWTGRERSYFVWISTGTKGRLS